MPQGERLLSIQRVAEVLDVSTRTVRRMWRRGQLPPPRRLPGGDLRWFASDVNYYLHQLRMTPPPEPEGGDNP